jgi:hypothetical protein
LLGEGEVEGGEVDHSQRRRGRRFPNRGVPCGERDGEVPALYRT